MKLTKKTKKEITCPNYTSTKYSNYIEKRGNLTSLLPQWRHATSREGGKH